MECLPHAESRQESRRDIRQSQYSVATTMMESREKVESDGNTKQTHVNWSWGQFVGMSRTTEQRSAAL